ncbi:phosphoadenylyl-sulfate reductase [Spirochaeta thermophila]|uniref:Adenosine 5'-phosphosulfate reductase n=1 Tax=Winmispira thermophila (strain ATCC 49972 / DSM 6192 / RI 19.B1) TaxID=665571 RepID=E0RN90_WINT6|nr:phosphoadenylyl-sulfate reductase [Spirochaeta thermophila]ADN02559.1 phosphoadenosine phosphosulfate reductase [Spirochaeta thermophila DSM 6192]
MDPKERVKTYRETLRGKSPQEVLAYFLDEWGEGVVQASSLGAEDQVITHMLLSLTPRPRVFVIDTGRLPEETYALLDLIHTRWELDLRVYAPEAEDVEDFVRTYGPNAFFRSVELRKRCCYIRKVKPLMRALEGAKVWITGLRKAQSPEREGVEVVEWDELHGLIKVNPLADWSDEEVWSYLKGHGVPYNVLHDRGYPSIGCEPCTRAVLPGEHPRAGRWWWEQGKKECGLHTERTRRDHG